VLPETLSLLAYAESNKDTLPLYQLRGLANVIDHGKMYLSPEDIHRFEELTAFIRQKLAPFILS
jgi:hypothetical protein